MGKDDALLRAGPVRLRPILMTAFSTIAGMLPIAIGLGEGAESRAPMGTCVVGGMLTSTVLTLIVIPAVYSAAEDVKSSIPRLVGWLTFTRRRKHADAKPTEDRSGECAAESEQDVAEPTVTISEIDDSSAETVSNQFGPRHEQPNDTISDISLGTENQRA
jgi:hypothetical protein